MAQLAMVGAAIGVGATAFQTYSEYLATRTAAKLDKIEAKSIRAETAAAEAADRRRSEKIIGKAHAIAAASGVDPGSGSPLLALLDSAREAELSALDIRHSGERRAEAKEIQSKFRKMAIPGIIAGGIAKATSILGGFVQNSGGPKSTGSVP